MLQLAQRTDAPSSFSVSIRIAVSMVMCSEPVMRTPLSGFCGPYFLRMDIKPGISFSEISMVLRPHSASDKSLTEKSCFEPLLDLVTVRRGGDSFTFCIGLSFKIQVSSGRLWASDGTDQSFTLR